MRRLLVLSMTGSLLALGACQKSPEPTEPAPTAAAPAASTPAGAPVLDAHDFLCGDLKVTAVFDGVGAVDLSYQGGPLTLPQAQSASGARFADDQGNEFWNKGEEATLTLAGQAKRDCKPAAPAS